MNTLHLLHNIEILDLGDADEDTVENATSVSIDINHEGATNRPHPRMGRSLSMEQKYGLKPGTIGSFSTATSVGQPLQSEKIL